MSHLVQAHTSRTLKFGWFLIGVFVFEIVALVVTYTK